ncbi:reverse transcriptase domain-containing protein [Tanacetum coccineum]|uniref:Reverse transcriptase domain-containing protein n=1 Tax=Tanacetum coccineum TaxID=301880 RepID=A0ABQ5AMJ5_9ASTR
MKLNLKKCSFGVEEGPFLGHLITKQGIKANPLKVKAVTDLDQPRTLKYIQSLNRKLAALSWFLSKGAERSLAFFKVLKGCKDKKSIQWIDETDKALEKIKKLVQALPTLTAPRVGETNNAPRRLKRKNEKETPADFLAEIPFEDNKKEEKSKEVPDSYSKWRLYTDGASNLDGSGAGLMLIDPKVKSTLMPYASSTFAAKQASIKDYLQKVKTTLMGFEEYIVEHVRRNQNKKADALSKLASTIFEHLTKEVLVEVLTKRSIEEKQVLKVAMQERKSWMGPIHEYLLSGLLTEDTKEARRIRIQAPQYKLI